MVKERWFQPSCVLALQWWADKGSGGVYFHLLRSCIEGIECFVCFHNPLLVWLPKLMVEVSAFIISYYFKILSSHPWNGTCGNGEETQNRASFFLVLCFLAVISEQLEAEKPIEFWASGVVWGSFRTFSDILTGCISTWEIDDFNQSSLLSEMIINAVIDAPQG